MNCDIFTIMNVKDRNSLFSKGELELNALWPKIEEYRSKRFQFNWDFGLDILPLESGLITIRGARQIGKSTWLEFQIFKTLQEFGSGSAFFLNGDYIYSHDEFEKELLHLESSFNKNVKVKRLFIDEITQIKDWQRVIKRLIDAGHLKDVLIVTTGSNSNDLRRASERLPGRKGGLQKSEYIFLPISYKEFFYQVESESHKFHNNLLHSYILSGGSPLAINSLYYESKLDENFNNIIYDWVLGNFTSSGRSRSSLLNLLKKLYDTSPSAVSYTKLSKESGLANNTTALEYIEKLGDLLCIYPMMQWDSSRDILLPRKESKFPFINLSFAWCFHPKMPRSVDEVTNLEKSDRGAMYEWTVANELWQREILNKQKSIKPQSNLEQKGLSFWKSKDNEVDFVTSDNKMYEVKSGSTSALDFSWFSKTFPKSMLTVICESHFETNHVISLGLNEFLLRKDA